MALSTEATSLDRNGKACSLLPEPLLMTLNKRFASPGTLCNHVNGAGLLGTMLDLAQGPRELQYPVLQVLHSLFYRHGVVILSRATNIAFPSAETIPAGPVALVTLGQVS